MQIKREAFYILSDVVFRTASNGSAYLNAKFFNGQDGDPDLVRAFNVHKDALEVGRNGLLAVSAANAQIDFYEKKRYLKLSGITQIDLRTIPREMMAACQKKPPFQCDPKEDLRTIALRADSISNDYLRTLVFYALHSAGRTWKEVSERIPFGKRPSLMSLAQQEDHALLRAWGAVMYHHAYSGGWVIHTAEVLETAIQLLLVHFGQNRYPKEDMNVLRDQVIAGSILHDLGKLFENEEDAFGIVQKSPLGELHGGDLEITLRAVEAISESMRKEFSLGMDLEAHEILMHTLSAHHGQYGPSIPRTLPAAIVQMADKASSSLAKMRDLILSSKEPGMLFLEGKPFFDIRHHFSSFRKETV